MQGPGLKLLAVRQLRHGALVRDFSASGTSSECPLSIVARNHSPYMSKRRRRPAALRPGPGGHGSEAKHLPIILAGVTLLRSVSLPLALAVSVAASVHDR
jgi:hypothetical protein